MRQGDPEAGHARIGDRQAVGAVRDQLLEEGHHAAARAEHIAIAHHRKAGAVGAGQIVGGDENLVGGELGGAIEIDRIGGLVGGQRHDPLDPGAQARADHILRPEDIGADTFEGIVLGGGDLLHGGGMDDKVHPVQRQLQPVAVAHIADEIADEGILRVREFLLHIELLEFVAGKDDQPARLVAGDHRLDEMFAEAAGAAGDQHGFLVQVHPGLGEVAQGRGPSRQTRFRIVRRNR